MSNQAVCLWKFHIDTYYAYVGGLFLATREEVQAVLGQRLSICDAMGKYGDVTETLMPCHFEFVTDDKSVIATIAHVLPVGYDPLEHVHFYCHDCGEYFSDDEYDSNLGLCEICSAKP